MLKWSFNEPLWVNGEYMRGCNVRYTVTIEYIIRIYWPSWLDRMIALDRGHAISFENCINDFLVINWARSAKC